MEDKTRVAASNAVIGAAVDVASALGVVRALEIACKGSADADSVLFDDDLQGALRAIDEILSVAHDSLEDAAGWIDQFKSIQRGGGSSVITA